MKKPFELKCQFHCFFDNIAVLAGNDFKDKKHH